MAEHSTLIIFIGILAQVCFGIRQVIQWWESEKAKSIQSPSAFWMFSLIGSVFFLIYGVLRLDFAIVLGQFLSFYIYCRNLYFKGVWAQLPRWLRYMILLFPIVIIIYLYTDHLEMFKLVFYNEDITSDWLLVGTIGYLILTVRYIHQWYVSERDGQSRLPVGFFVMSIVGSLMIVAYGIYRSDIILILGYLGGLVVYIRNLMINY